MPGRLLGALLPGLAAGGGLLAPRTAATAVLLPAALVLSGALIGRWWAPFPSVAVVALLNLAELAGLCRSGTTVELHTGGFSVRSLVLTCGAALALTLLGLGLRRALLATATLVAPRRRGG